MGWWGYGIMDGDTPSDFKCTIEQAVVGEKVWRKLNDTGNWDEQMKKMDELVGLGLRKDKTGDHRKLFTAINKDTASWKHDRPIGYQVIGVMVMEAGAKLSAKAKKKIIDACYDDAVDFKSAGSRRQALTDLRNKLKKYKGKPVNVKQTGLFETILKGLAKDNK